MKKYGLPPTTTIFWTQVSHMRARDIIGECTAPKTHKGQKIGALEAKFFICSPPRFNIHNRSVNVEEGRAITIDCVPDEGSPDPDIIWEDKYGKKIKKYDESFKVNQ